MKLIIIRGGGASGKTTIARKLAKDMRIQLFVKDDYKESQFDKLGRYPSLKEIKILEEDSWRKTYSVIKKAIKESKPLIIEGNFMAPQKRAFQKLIKSDTEVIEIYCLARGMTQFRRYVKRNKSGERHTGHRDHLWYVVVFFESLASGMGFKPYRPFKLPGSRYIEVNTKDFAKIDYPAITRFIR